MKLEFLILSIFLINSAMSIITNEMQSGSEKTFSDLRVNQVYYFTIRAYEEKQYAFKIKVKNTYNTNSLSLSYIAHTSPTPSSKNKDEGKAFFIISSSYTPGYNTYESLYTVIDSSIDYVTFTLTFLKNIDSASITITESKPSRFTINPILLIVIVIFGFCFIVGIIGCIWKKCSEKKSKIEPSPQIDNYSPLSLQNQSPNPEQPQYTQ